jgi:hypothetical protein
MHVVVEYNHEIFVPLLFVIYKFLTLVVVNVEIIGFVTCELGVIGTLDSKWLHEGFLELNCHFSRRIQCLLMISIL